MKKKSCLTLALILAIVQVVSLFAVLPVSAETTPPNYSLIKSTETMTVDGKADEVIWTRAVWSEQFVRVDGNYDGASSFNVQYKALWAPAENNKMNVYLLVVAKGIEIPTSTWANTCSIQIQIGNEAGTGYFWSGLRNLKSQILENATAPNLTNGGSVADWSKSYQLAAVEDITGSKTVTFEFCYQMDKADSIKFDVMVRGGFYGSQWSHIDSSWAGTTNSTMENAPAGIGTILDQTYLYGIDIPKTTRTMTVDGKADEGAWSKAEWSEKFVRVGGGYDKTSSLNVQYKALWAPAENNKMNVYLLVVAKGIEIPTSTWANTCSIQIQIGNEAGTGYFWSGLRNLKSQILENPTAPDLTNGGSVADWSKSYQLAAVEDIEGSKTVTFEFCYQMDKADRISVDVMVRGGFFGSQWSHIDSSWAKTTNATMEQAPAGLGNIIDADAEGVELTMTDGASVRVDTTEAKTSGIRFASTVNLDQYNALLAQGATIKTGTLIVPTNSLTVKEIADADFTKETLLAKGLIENTHFYDIVNTGNEWVEGEDGTWYATLYDIQDYERLFSAVGYVTVELNDVSTTYYAEYYSVDARSIAQVAETLMSGETEGDEGKWTAAQEAVLKNFFTQGAQS